MKRGKRLQKKKGNLKGKAKVWKPCKKRSPLPRTTRVKNKSVPDSDSDFKRSDDSDNDFKRSDDSDDDDGFKDTSSEEENDSSSEVSAQIVRTYLDMELRAPEEIEEANQNAQKKYHYTLNDIKKLKMNRLGYLKDLLELNDGKVMTEDELGEHLRNKEYDVMPHQEKYEQSLEYVTKEFAEERKKAWRDTFHPMGTKSTTQRI